ncbi:MAG: hypothetical protein K2X47_04985 [Bdellovibrionales bacterium]|nr:hypothetical protein [Bdellovibrionales bacterium]
MLNTLSASSVLLISMAFFSIPEFARGDTGPALLRAPCDQLLKDAIQTHDNRVRYARDSVREFLKGIPQQDLEAILELESLVLREFDVLRNEMRKEPDFWEIRKRVIDAQISKILVAEANAAVLEPLRLRHRDAVLRIAAAEFNKGQMILRSFLPQGASFGKGPHSFLKTSDLNEFWKKRIERFNEGLEPFSYPKSSWQVTLWRQPDSLAQAQSWVIYRILFAAEGESLWEMPPISIDNGASTLFFQPKGKSLQPLPVGPGKANITYNTQNSKSVGEIEVSYITYRQDEESRNAGWKGLFPANYTQMIAAQLSASCLKKLKYDPVQGKFDGSELSETLPKDQRPRISGPRFRTTLPNSRVISLISAND